MEKGAMRFYLKIIRKRLKLILAIILLFSILSIWDYFYSPKNYRTSAKFSTIKTEQVDFMKTPVAAKQVARRVGFDDTKKLLSMIKVRPSGEEGTFILYVKGQNPKKITSVANAWVTISGVRIIEKAMVPKEPLPRNTKIIILAGVILGLVVCFFLEYLDHTLRTSAGVEFYAKMPFLGWVPPVMGSDASTEVINMITHVKPDALLAETFRNIKASLIFSAPSDNPLGTIMVTSSVLEEGKSFVASNLAIAFARAGDSTLLIDADLKKGALGEMSDIKTDKGLGSYLSGMAGLDESVISTYVENLFLLPSGKHIEDPSDVLRHEKVGEILRSLKTRFKRIVIDVPAVLDSDEALAWADKCDGQLYVIGAGFTPLEDVNAAKDKLGAKAKILGAVLNNVAQENDVLYYARYLHFYIQNKLWTIKRGKKPVTDIG